MSGLTPGVEFLTTFGLIDVTDVAPLVRCPTMFVHSRGDRRQPLIDAKALAALIDGSEMVALPSRSHLPLADEPAWPLALDAIESFLAAADPAGVCGGTGPVNDVLR